jgi:CubicO group peptidase (beta-lactamase class C family)
MPAVNFSRADIDLSNWRQRPFNMFAFQNVSEIVPSMIVRGARKAEAPVMGLGSLDRLEVENLAGEKRPLPNFLAESESDALVVMRGGKVVAEWYAAHCDPFKPHIIFSISKSVTGLLAGILVDRGQLSYEDLVSKHVPDAAGSAYGDLKVRHLVDMTVALDFEEAYLDKSGDYDRYRRAMLWNPERAEEPTPTLRQLLCSLRRADHEHGTRHAYRSPNADMAALVIEGACGMRYGNLLEETIWQPMGAFGDAHLTVDRAGNARSSGGLSFTPRDLARLGELLRIGGAGVLPASLVDELWAGGNRKIWAEGDQQPLFPGGSYRNFWYETGTGALAGMGIHGQQLWIDRATETVIVRNASETLPVDDALDQKIIAMLDAITKA